MCGASHLGRYVQGGSRRAGLGAGASIINDISALRGRPRDGESRGRRERGGVVLMHMQGIPRTMQDNPRYEDVVREIYDFLAQRIEWAESIGIVRDRIAIDPGIGFGKTIEHNLQTLAEPRSICHPGLCHPDRHIAEGVPGNAHRAGRAERAVASVVSSLAACADGSTASCGCMTWQRWSTRSRSGRRSEVGRRHHEHERGRETSQSVEPSTHITSSCASTWPSRPSGLPEAGHRAGAAKNAWLKRSAEARSGAGRRSSRPTIATSPPRPAAGSIAAAIDRLTLEPKRIDDMARPCATSPPSPTRSARSSPRAGGPMAWTSRQVRVPLGVIFMIYESRPNVTVDAAALCVKSGNAAILRGGKEAIHSNRALHRVLADELAACRSSRARRPARPDDRSRRRRRAAGLPEYIDLAIPGAARA